MFIFGDVKVFFFFCFKQLLLNIKKKIEVWYHLIHEKRLLSVVVGVLSFSAVKPCHFHYTKPF